jgi:hypothetical protein
MKNATNPTEDAAECGVQAVRGDPGAEAVFHRLGGKELGDQIEPAITDPEPIEDHSHRRGAHADLLLIRSGQRIQIVRSSDLLADADHDPQMVPPFDTHAPHAPQSPHEALLPWCELPSYQKLPKVVP